MLEPISSPFPPHTHISRKGAVPPLPFFRASDMTQFSAGIPPWRACARSLHFPSAAPPFSSPLTDPEMGAESSPARPAVQSDDKCAERRCVVRCACTFTPVHLHRKQTHLPIFLDSANFSLACCDTFMQSFECCSAQVHNCPIHLNK